ncbi:hypothetical protein HELRODRAFT_189399 [Helobdella robusta]|uniref:Nucleoside phosphorylase domain-containing protein n=1 Tax=Helobdella robusta TaxID=6412 RepID=T1FR09_HELRO|nr:hypothetical protein HELRODRAFT_189399 [Helobdella robusta]ESN94465.1 hypothetical protein HELRODRAFT_189399 [Helobdella robusta]
MTWFERCSKLECYHTPCKICVCVCHMVWVIQLLWLAQRSKMLKVDETTMKEQLKVLLERNLIKELEPGRWVRKVLDKKSELRIVKNMPSQMDGTRPKVAIITSKYYEKLAVDAMMEDKTTFVKFKTEGESNVYTIGFIAGQKVVSTKLPAIGRQRAAQISSGNTTTRLLGTFGEIDHVLLVGVCGGVPHYADYYKHVRLGDLLVSSPVDNSVTSTTSAAFNNNASTASNDYYYIYCDKTTQEKEEDELKSTQFSLKGWRAPDSTLLNVARDIASTKTSNTNELLPWEKYIIEGQKILEGQEVEFTRPPEETDRLFMNVGGNDVIEVGHPAMPEPSSNGPPGEVHSKQGFPMIRMGPIGSGKPIVNNDQLRLEFAAKHQCIGFDSEFDQVLESIDGNRKDSYLLIRGVSDYLDGSTNITWQPYAALVAAAFMKSIIAALYQ